MKTNGNKEKNEDYLRTSQYMATDWDSYFKCQNRNGDNFSEGTSYDVILKTLCGETVILLDLLWWHAGLDMHNEWRITSRILLDSFEDAYHALPSYALHLWRRLSKVRVMNKLSEHCPVLSYYFDWWKDANGKSNVNEDSERIKQCLCIGRYADIMNKGIVPFAPKNPACWLENELITPQDTVDDKITVAPETDNDTLEGVKVSTILNIEDKVRYPPPFKFNKKRTSRPHGQVDLQKVRHIITQLRALLIVPVQDIKVSPIIELYKDVGANKMLQKLFVLLALLPAPNALSQTNNDRKNDESVYLLGFNPLFIAFILHEGSKLVHKSLVYDSLSQHQLNSESEENHSKRKTNLNFIPMLIAHGVILYPRRLSSLCLYSKELLTIWVKSALEAYSFNKWGGLKLALGRASGTILGSKITIDYFTRILSLSRHLLPKFYFEELSISSLTELISFVQSGCDRKAGRLIFEHLISLIYELVTLELNKSVINEATVKAIVSISQLLEISLSEYLNLMVNKVDKENIDIEYDEAALLLGKNELSKNILVAQVYHLLIRIRRELKIPEGMTKNDVVILYRNDVLLSLASQTKSNNVIATVSDNSTSNSGRVSSQNTSANTIGTTVSVVAGVSKVEGLWQQVKNLLIQRET